MVHELRARHVIEGCMLVERWRCCAEVLLVLRISARERERSTCLVERYRYMSVREQSVYSIWLA